MELQESLKIELAKELPGKKFQNKMSPKGRRQMDNGQILSRDAAVAIILYRSGKKFEFILMKRPVYNGAHSGQISFPGGKKEKKDNTLIKTAQRETYEEIGIRLENINLLGKLSPLIIPVSGFIVQPYIFYLQSLPQYIPNKQEVDYLIHADLDSILNPGNKKETTIHYKDLSIKTPYYEINDEVVWGATAMILSEFEEIIRRLI